LKRGPATGLVHFDLTVRLQDFHSPTFETLRATATSFSFGRFHSETGNNKAARGASPPNLNSLLAVAEA